MGHASSSLIYKPGGVKVFCPLFIPLDQEIKEKKSKDQTLGLTLRIFRKPRNLVSVFVGNPTPIHWSSNLQKNPLEQNSAFSDALKKAIHQFTEDEKFLFFNALPKEGSRQKEAVQQRSHVRSVGKKSTFSQTFHDEADRKKNEQWKTLEVLGKTALSASEGSPRKDRQQIITFYQRASEANPIFCGGPANPYRGHGFTTCRFYDGLRVQVGGKWVGIIQGAPKTMCGEECFFVKPTTGEGTPGLYSKQRLKPLQSNSSAEQFFESALFRHLVDQSVAQVMSQTTERGDSKRICRGLPARA